MNQNRENSSKFAKMSQDEASYINQNSEKAVTKM